MQTKHIFMYKTSKKQDVENVDKIYVYSPFNEKKSQISKCTIIEVAAYGVHHVCCKRQTICRRLEEMVITNFSRGPETLLHYFLESYDNATKSINVCLYKLNDSRLVEFIILVYFNFWFMLK